MSDDLPVDIDTEASSGDDEGTSIWTWVAGAGGVVVAVYVLNWLFGILFGLMSFLVYYGIIALLVYGAYRGVKHLLSDDSGSTAASDEQVALPDDIDVEAELESGGAEGELGSDLESELAGGDLQSELDGIEADVETPDVEPAEVSAERDDELEKKFEQLEKEMNE
ncbi:MAG: hypothetical protein ABEN55_19600 [Bradymonadaceae bacterium]